MRIDILCHPKGSRGVRPRTIWGDRHRIGVGGSELALLTMCEEWARRGYEVRLYNDPYPGDEPQLFEQLPLAAFDAPGRRDVLIVFRSPIDLGSARGKRVWWICDLDEVGNFAAFRPAVHQAVCLSSFHQALLRSTCGIVETVQIDLPVRLADYDAVGAMSRRLCQMLFSSVPDRGLAQMIPIWDRIKRLVPAANLVITSDYRLWGATDPCNHEYAQAFARKEDVRFLGAVRRGELIRHQLESAILAYPCRHTELFCLAVAEASVAGALPLTSTLAALSTTNLGCVIPIPVTDAGFEDCFVDTLAELLTDEERTQRRREDVVARARVRFDPQAIVARWDESVFHA